MQNTRRRFKGLADCARQTWRAEGLKGLYRFYGVDILLRMGGGVMLVLYDEVKGGLHGAQGGRGLSLVGAQQGLDDIRSRLWSQPAEATSSDGASIE